MQSTCPVRSAMSASTWSKPRQCNALADAFAELTRQGRLNTPDAALAATQFNWLIMSAPVNQAMLLGQDAAPATREINRWADSGVRTFLAAYH